MGENVIKLPYVLPTWWAGISPSILHQNSLLFMFEVHCHRFVDTKWRSWQVWTRTRHTANCTLLTSWFCHWVTNIDAVRAGAHWYLQYRHWAQVKILMAALNAELKDFHWKHSQTKAHSSPGLHQRELTDQKWTEAARLWAGNHWCE